MKMNFEFDFLGKLIVCRNNCLVIINLDLEEIEYKKSFSIWYSLFIGFRKGFVLMVFGISFIFLELELLIFLVILK